MALPGDRRERPEARRVPGHGSRGGPAGGLRAKFNESLVPNLTNQKNITIRIQVSRPQGHRRGQAGPGAGSRVQPASGSVLLDGNRSSVTERVAWSMPRDIRRPWASGQIRIPKQHVWCTFVAFDVLLCTAIDFVGTKVH